MARIIPVCAPRSHADGRGGAPRPSPGPAGGCAPGPFPTRSADTPALRTSLSHNRARRAASQISANSAGKSRGLMRDLLTIGVRASSPSSPQLDLYPSCTGISVLEQREGDRPPPHPLPLGGGISHWTADISSPPNGRGLRGGRSKIVTSLAREYRKPKRDGYSPSPDAASAPPRRSAWPSQGFATSLPGRQFLRGPGATVALE
jgi:hypothetical protein